MLLIMTNLRLLHQSMLGQLNEYGEPIEHQSFRSVHGAVSFECIFSTSEQAYMLSMVSRGTAQHPHPEFFLFAVSGRYEISNRFDEKDYWRLVNLLRTRNGETNNTFRPFDFLTQLDANTPTVAAHQSTPDLRTRLESRPDITEEMDKPYFSHWRRPPQRADGTPGQVSRGNRQKTAMISSTALEYSDRMGLSSCWSAEPTQADWRPRN